MPTWMQLQTVNQHTYTYYTHGSIGNPAESANRGMMAIGAMDWRTPLQIEYFSSVGPTPDGRTKPDLVGLDQGYSTAWDGIFNGTSQAAPHLAGLVASVRQAVPYLSPPEVVDYLTHGAERRGIATNNTWGWGFAKLPPAHFDYDADDDGLIEVSTLRQLDAIRWDLDGDGDSTNRAYSMVFVGVSAGMGCTSSGCIGYELISNLDLDTNGDGSAGSGDHYWNGGKGLQSIGGRSRNPFEATLHGNSHTISNVFNQPPQHRLRWPFGATGYGSVIRNVGLESPHITGDQLTGTLAGEHLGKVSMSYTSGGSVVGTWWVGVCSAATSWAAS